MNWTRKQLEDMTSLSPQDLEKKYGLPVAVAMQKAIELRPTDPDYPESFFAVYVDDDCFGDIERRTDGTWVGDITLGNGPPSKPYATCDEAVAYVVNPY